MAAESWSRTGSHLRTITMGVIYSLAPVGPAKKSECSRLPKGHRITRKESGVRGLLGSGEGRAGVASCGVQGD